MSTAPTAPAPVTGAAGRGRAPLVLAPLVEEAAEVTAAHARRTDTEAVFPLEALDSLRRTRLLGLLVPSADGGLGGRLGDMLTATRRLGREDMSLAMVFAMHCQQVAALAQHANGTLRGELLPRIGAGEVYLASVTTEAGKGGALLSATAPLQQREGDLLLDRFAPIVTGGAHADGFLVTMRSPHSDSEHDVSLVYADRSQLEVACAGGWDPHGMRASHSGALHLRGSVPGHQVVGEHGRFRDIVTHTFGPLAHLGWSAAWLGTAEGALARTVAMLRSGRTRGGALLDSELLLTRLARVRHRLEAVAALLARTLDAVLHEDVSRPRVQLLVNGLKVTASEQCHAAVQELVDAVGLRHGYLRDSPLALERALRDLRSASLNFSNDRLLLADGRLTLLDPEVRLA
ncbi:acyl-CoA dehydrogenase family protein [Streptomyces collinus]|uniref:Acyl-CoA dehydrogenase n=1 Tax=Streptomyces collinus (strain DSM 40733 / Tue 365) TaxID=1214242 RepID=S5V8Y8_STRC3|nr:acyl-CoA dehydrogenase family protein [Streptomyces collinus]AGS66932.1 acyl-CoA dehydrogenase [Streptomyces collinus Tu 365]AGS73762.1 acyl-CoA dehydrogenase [Streptomyces collinus Tu 365]